MAARYESSVAPLLGLLDNIKLSLPGESRSSLVVTALLAVLASVFMSASRKNGKSVNIPIALSDSISSKSKRIEMYCQDSRDVLVRGYQQVSTFSTDQ